MKMVFSDAYRSQKKQINACVNAFKTAGEPLDKNSRNTLKIFPLGADLFTIKSFKVPNLLNKVVYRYIRKSKAQRSFEYAHELKKRGIGTPAPIAYFEEEGLLFGHSYYCCALLEYDITYRGLMRDSAYADNEEILAAFAKFTYELHQKEIHFIDHSPGNTLIQINNGKYRFFLVDLNRMEFKKLDFQTRMNNFRRLSKYPHHVKIMAEAYAEVSGEDPQRVYDAMLDATVQFQNDFQKKRRLKKKLRFWKS